ncbi:hypothetical protein MBCUT_06970 [Methanobrevibacter cuticularis]|uniref:Baseplate structural protein Gp10 C-terminal domain-containing protein n=1 Tax=Methanobrevibacter cuticularis TaxID=47311 RepID=A0A166EHG9_9EURY|nr:hypothetical protein [Methanobrevibacter cuticularis]KZX16659.1 hypothetical protein MBCUT_06970 [Methanobrevibacter cuticularis]
MVKIKKDSRKWFFKGSSKKGKEEFPVEWLNGVMSYIETGNQEAFITLPFDFENGQFPDDEEEHEAKFASNIFIKGNFENNQENIIINREGSFKINFYPNIAPFHRFKKVIVETSTQAQLRLLFRDFAGNIVYNEITNVASGKAVFSLEPLELNLQTVTAEIITNSDETQINNIIFSFDLKAEKVDQIFKNLVRLNQEGKIDVDQLDIKYISGAETIAGEELPVNNQNNNVILPENLFPDIILDDDCDLYISWDPTDVSAQINQLKQQVENLQSIVENTTIPYDVGDIISTTNSKNPATRTGWEHTTWEAYAKGRVLVGIDQNDSDFSSAGKMGGAKKHKLNVNEMPSHNHAGSIGGGGSGNTGSNSHAHGLHWDHVKLSIGGSSIALVRTDGSNTSSSSVMTTNTHYHTLATHTHSMSIGSTGGSGEHNNLQPYVSVYIWRRVA